MVRTYSKYFIAEYMCPIMFMQFIGSLPTKILNLILIILKDPSGWLYNYFQEGLTFANFAKLCA